ncbi:hypothetical protein ACSBR2_024425 [Camellia fascicularis]
MLQRAASNAYSWWWASHIRTKQSKWLDQSLQDMEEKVQTTLKLIQEDGDSFAKRAEMYYKKRPELINFVQESFRAYRALAERYDHISKELQNANNTIASVFPEQVQYEMEEEDDYGPPPVPKNVPQPAASSSSSSSANNNVPKIPKCPTRDLKCLLTSASKKLQAKKTAEATKSNKNKTGPKSGLSKSEAVEEIDKVQKEILALQTVKEFVKSSYESGLTKYWEIDHQITELQKRVFSLQDEFSVGKVIEDDEARTLMAEAALKSCEETLTQLQEKQERSTKEAKAEFRRVENVHEKLNSLKHKFLPDQQAADEEKKPNDKDDKSANAAAKSRENLQCLNPEAGSMMQERQELDALREKIKEHFEVDPKQSLTVTELAEKINDLVSKVISLETSVSSQTALIDGLKTETDDFQAQIQTLEDDKATLIDDTNTLTNKLREMEEKFNRLQHLNQNVESQNNNLQTHFIEARCSLDHLSEKLQGAKPEEEHEHMESIQEEQEEESSAEVKKQEFKLQENMPRPKDGSINSGELKAAVGDDKNGQVGYIDSGELIAAVGDDKSGQVLCIAGDSPINTKELKAAVGEDKNGQKAAVGDDKSGQVLCIAGDGPLNTKELKAAVGEDRNGQVLRMSVNNQREKEEEEEKEKVNQIKLEYPQSLDKVDKNGVSLTADNVVNTEPQEVANEKDDEPNWQEMFKNGLEDREKILLTEYTAILRNYKDVKKKLGDIENKNRDSLFETTVQLRDMRSAIAKRDDEIHSLRQKLKLLLENFDEKKDLKENNQSISIMLDGRNAKPEATENKVNGALEVPLIKKEEEDVELILIYQQRSISPIEEKLRTNIDALLDENLDFWLRFSTSFHQIQKFKTGFQDLQAEISKIKEKEKSSQEGSVNATTDIKSDLRPIYKHLREIQTELTRWIEQSTSLKDELQRRFSSLCNIQEEITNALTEGAEEEETLFTSHDAAKFQGEVVNMKQENNKVRDELQTGLDHATTLQQEIENTLAKLDEEFDISGSKNNDQPQLRHSTSRTRVPLRSFIFGTKPKKKTSIFACMHHRKYHDLRAGLSL